MGRWVRAITKGAEGLAYAVGTAWTMAVFSSPIIIVLAIAYMLIFE